MTPTPQTLRQHCAHTEQCAKLSSGAVSPHVVENRGTHNRTHPRPTHQRRTMGRKIRHPLDKRSTRQWRLLVARVIAEEPICWLRLAGCTYRSTTGDHIIPVNVRPDLCMVRANVRGACFHCNSARQDTPPDQLPSRTAPGVLEELLEWWDD